MHVTNPKAPPAYSNVSKMLGCWQQSGTYSEELSCENSIAGVVIGKSPESSSDHQEAECQAEEDHYEDDVCSKGA
jgi:hypothetical protein